MTLPAASHQPIEFWFEFGSNYSYLAAMRITALAGAAGVTVLWRPFLLAPIFRELGWNTSPFALQGAKGRYMWRDMERQTAKYGLPWRRPSAFPRAAVLPMRVAALGMDEPWIGDFCRRVMQQNWVRDREIDDPAAVAEALAGLVSDPQAVLDAAVAPNNKLRLRTNTESASARGIFGAPIFLWATKCSGVTTGSRTPLRWPPPHPEDRGRIRIAACHGTRSNAPTQGRQLVYDSAMFSNTQQAASHARFR